jgi:hypothetical protein
MPTTTASSAGRVRLFRRGQPLHRQLAEAAGLIDPSLRTPAPAAQPPGWYGDAAGEAGIHGVPRARTWDVVVTARAPQARGDALYFVALPDGTIVLVDDGAGDADIRGEGAGAALPGDDADAHDQRAAPPPDQPAGAVSPLADAVETRLEPPYRAEAVRRESDTWAVAASRISVVAAPGLEGEEAVLVSGRDGRTLHVDGRPRFGSVPAFEAVGSAQGAAYVVRARRVDEALWEVEASAL